MLIEISRHTNIFGKKILITSALYIALKTEKRKVVTHYNIQQFLKISMKIRKVMPISIGCPQKPYFAFTIHLYGCMGDISAHWLPASTRKLKCHSYFNILLV